jgi:hypothetical protein
MFGNVAACEVESEPHKYVFGYVKTWFCFGETHHKLRLHLRFNKSKKVELYKQQLTLVFQLSIDKPVWPQNTYF